ncbi:hypothetical protein B795N_05060 [Marinilactibacillus psychrotolerans]|nr:hypothetical protein B795N_05060 [Marinilactibacillus psychrotolerans]
MTIAPRIIIKIRMPIDSILLEDAFVGDNEATVFKSNTAVSPTLDRIR